MTANTVPVSAGEVFEVLSVGWKAQSTGAMCVLWLLHDRPGIG